METLTEKRKRAGAKGGKAKKGKKTAKVIERDKVHDELRDMIADKARPLFHAAFSNAMGNAFLIRIDKKYEKGARGGQRVVSVKHVVVEDTHEILNVLDEWQGDMDRGLVDEKYYYITTKRPDSGVIRDLWDRGFGKSPQSIDLGNKDNKPFIIKIDT